MQPAHRKGRFGATRRPSHARAEGLRCKNRAPFGANLVYIHNRWSIAPRFESRFLEKAVPSPRKNEGTKTMRQGAHVDYCAAPEWSARTEEPTGQTPDLRNVYHSAFEAVARLLAWPFRRFPLANRKA